MLLQPPPGGNTAGWRWDTTLRAIVNETLLNFHGLLLNIHVEGKFVILLSPRVTKSDDLVGNGGCLEHGVWSVCVKSFRQ